MSRSIQEEIISALWAICALLAFGFGFTGWGWAFAIKAAADAAWSIGYAVKEAMKEIAEKKGGAA